jgi:hypothetical protein
VLICFLLNVCAYTSALAMNKVYQIFLYAMEARG